MTPPARSSFEDLRASLRELPREALPEFLGDLARLEAEARLRLTLPGTDRPPQPDRTLNAREVAELLGMGKDWVYAHADEIPGSWRKGKVLRFSAAAVEAWKR